MTKKRKQIINVTEVLEELKASVFALYKWKKKPLSAKGRKELESISAEDILPYFSNSEIKDWQKQNTAYKIFDYTDYLQWLEKNVSTPDRKGEYTKQIVSIKKDERKRMKFLMKTWEKLHTVFFSALDPVVLKLLNQEHEQKHLADKAGSLHHSDRLSSETKEEVRFDFYSLVQRKASNGSSNTLGNVSSIPVIKSKASSVSWIKMMKELSEWRYISEEYGENEELVRQWIACALSFSSMAAPISSISKLKWIGPATAFAGWIIEVRDRYIDYRSKTYRSLLRWVDATIDYPGGKQSLISALSASVKYNTEYFSFSGKGSNVSFEVRMSPRASKRKR